MTNRSGFTLIEVSVAGSLIAFTVLTALAIIPYGLRTQNEARMRTAAAATVMTMGASGSVKSHLTVDTTLLGTITRWEGRSVIPWKPGDPAPVSGLYIWTTPVSGDLAYRLAYSIQESGARAITVWLLAKDRTSPSPNSATYLTTFTEAAY
jgi:Tfp pilus assembly protein PilV